MVVAQNSPTTRKMAWELGKFLTIRNAGGIFPLILGIICQMLVPPDKHGIFAKPIPLNGYSKFTVAWKCFLHYWWHYWTTEMGPTHFEFLPIILLSKLSWRPIPVYLVSLSGIFVKGLSTSNEIINLPWDWTFMKSLTKEKESCVVCWFEIQWTKNGG